MLGGAFEKLILNVKDYEKTTGFWGTTLGFPLVSSKADKSMELRFGSWSPGAPDSFILRFQEISDPSSWDRGTAFGRVAFAVPTNQLHSIQETVKKNGFGGQVITPLVTLDTPGKASVSVVICADPVSLVFQFWELYGRGEQFYLIVKCVFSEWSRDLLCRGRRIFGIVQSGPKSERTAPKVHR